MMVAHPHSMPHWINLSYYGSSRRQARAGGKRYRPRLIPPAGLKVERRRTFVDAGHMPRLDTFTDEGEDDRLFDEFDGGAFRAVGPAQPPPPPTRGYLGR